MRKTVLVTLATVWLASASSGQTPRHHIVITLERTSCYGSCPVYKLRIDGDGSVTYEGERFVRVMGTRTSKIEQSDVDLLLNAFADIGYFDLKDAYDSIENPDGSFTMVTDLPTTYTSINLDERLKGIRDYIGAPAKLKELEHRIDAIAGSKRWVTIDAATVNEECMRGWNVHGAEAAQLLLGAARSGDVEVVKAFLKGGADVNGFSGMLAPLQEARGVDMVKLLTAAGADVNRAREPFAPPLVHAAELGDAESIIVLLQAGARVDSSWEEGTTALMEAARSGNPEAVKALLAAGASVKLQNQSGEDALEYARLGAVRNAALAERPDAFERALPDYRNKFKKIEQLLVAAGAARTQPVIE